jgi:hypothetical protein
MKLEFFKAGQALWRVTAAAVVVCFAATILFAELLRERLTLEGLIGVSPPGQPVELSSMHQEPCLKSVRLDPDHPTRLEFFIDSADSDSVDSETALRLVRYFMAGLTVPAQALWVNLSPYEPDRILPQALAATDMGVDMLLQDYELKQISASLTHPDTPTGEAYWCVENGKSKIENTLDKVWIVADKPAVYEYPQGVQAVIASARLAVMAEEEYLGQRRGPLDPGAGNEALRERILPELIEDVNYGQRFSRLRQMYHSLILAEWFKEKFKASFYRHYIDQTRIAGIDTRDSRMRDAVYQVYVEAFEANAYDVIRRQSDGSRRRYAAGGITISSAVERRLTPPDRVYEGRPYRYVVDMADIQVSAPATGVGAGSSALRKLLLSGLLALSLATPALSFNVDSSRTVTRRKQDLAWTGMIGRYANVLVNRWNNSDFSQPSLPDTLVNRAALDTLQSRFYQAVTEQDKELMDQLVMDMSYAKGAAEYDDWGRSYVNHIAKRDMVTYINNVIAGDTSLNESERSVLITSLDRQIRCTVYKRLIKQIEAGAREQFGDQSLDKVFYVVLPGHEAPVIRLDRHRFYIADISLGISGVLDLRDYVQQPDGSWTRRNLPKNFKARRQVWNRMMAGADTTSPGTFCADAENFGTVFYRLSFGTSVDYGIHFNLANVFSSAHDYEAAERQMETGLGHLEPRNYRAEDEFMLADIYYNRSLKTSGVQKRQYLARTVNAVNRGIAKYNARIKAGSLDYNDWRDQLAELYYMQAKLRTTYGFDSDTVDAGQWLPACEKADRDYKAALSHAFDDNVKKVLLREYLIFQKEFNRLRNLQPGEKIRMVPADPQNSGSAVGPQSNVGGIDLGAIQGLSVVPDDSLLGPAPFSASTFRGFRPRPLTLEPADRSR